MSRALKLGGAALAALVLVSGAGLWWLTSSARVDGAELPAATPADVLDYLAAHRENVAFATWEIGDAEHGLFLNADRAQPLASVVKLQALVEYASKLDPQEAVDRDAWERFYLAGTDGGAHPDALAELGTRDRYTARELAWAMIRHSDNAAFDWFLFRLGHTSGPPHPLSGEFLACSDAVTTERADEDAWRMATAVHDGQPARLPPCTLPQALRCARLINNRGTARDSAKLLERIVEDGVPNAAHVRELLEWPMQAFESNRETFESFGAKGGTLPGVITNTAYARPKDSAKTRVYALFLKDLPVGFFRNLTKTYANQYFQLAVLTDASFRAQVEARLR